MNIFKKDNKKYYRHGDISFHPVEEKPEGLKEVQKGGQFVLAWGEVTGHKHLLKEREADSFTIFQDNEGRYVLDIKKPTDLVHEEHKQITLEPGIYVQEQEKEFNYFEMRRQHVID